MKKLFFCLGLASCLCAVKPLNANTLWQQVSPGQAPSSQLMVMQPSHYQVNTFNETATKLQMSGLSTNPDEGMVLALPLPDGTVRDFWVWQSPMLDEQMSEKYPDIKTFTGVAVSDPRVTAKLDFTLYGFHAMIFDGTNTSFVDPYDRLHDGFYLAHYLKDEVRSTALRMKCEVKGMDEDGPAGESMDIVQKGLPQLAARTDNGWTSRTYRLALSADHQYCQAATGLSSPTIAQALSCMTTSVNRVSGVYEREFSVHMVFCSKEDTLIWPTASGSINGTDPFSSIDANGLACLPANETQCNTRVGSTNYDFGHVFTTGGGGISSVGVVCSSGTKARSCTGLPYPVGDGFDINYVAHEMGHEFGSQHTFNNNMDGSCGSNAVAQCAYEPGSGATIMDYAGICPPDDLQANSDPYFSASSLLQIYSSLSGSENTCAVTASTGNKLVSASGFTASYTIPYKTPFELIAPTAVDSVADTATTYCWAEWDLGDFGKELVQTYVNGPIFRSCQPAYTPLRVFPRVSMVMAGNLSNAGIENAEGEKAPDTARSLKFKMVYRDIINAYGCFLFPDDSIKLTAVATSDYRGFKVTSQATSGISYTGGSTQTVTWNVEGTNAAPVNATNVVIYLSLDGGNTWVYGLGTFPNTGSATVTIPNPAAITGSARIKVKGSGNVFFNVNSSSFTITHNSSIGTTPTGVVQVNNFAGEIKVYPVPATDILHINMGNSSSAHATIYNSMGQLVWRGEVSGNSEISLNNWSKGIYYARFMDANTGEMAVKTFIAE